MYSNFTKSISIVSVKYLLNMILFGWNSHQKSCIGLPSSRLGPETLRRFGETCIQSANQLVDVAARNHQAACGR
jgi:hypothetical protein